MHKITVEDIVTFIEANPRRKNPGAPKKIEEGAHASCKYFDEGSRPSCVIGNIVATVTNIPVKNLAIRFEENSDVDSYHSFFANEDAQFLATEIQQYADKGHTWGKALKLAQENT